MKNSEFFNSISTHYDEMINFENSLKNKTITLKSFILQDYKTALDLGCGSGADSIALTRLGLRVDAVDHSKGMLKQALQNAKKYGADINILHSGLGELDLQNNKYDLIVSLGNTIANIDDEELKTLLEKLKNHLLPNGKIVIQLVNYSTLPKTGSYILNKFENEKLSILRKYNIRNTHIDFIVEKIKKESNEKSEIVTKLFPYSTETFSQHAKENNFNVNFFGSLKKEPYIEKESKNLIIVFSNK